MDATLTPPLLPNPPIANRPKEILMAEPLPSYKNIVARKIIPHETSLGTSDPNRSEVSKSDVRKILLSKKDEIMQYAPWIHFVIIKPIKGNFNHQYLKKKLDDLWKLTEPLCLIDLGMVFFTVKLSKSESQASILHG